MLSLLIRGCFCLLGLQFAVRTNTLSHQEALDGMVQECWPLCSYEVQGPDARLLLLLSHLLLLFATSQEKLLAIVLKDAWLASFQVRRFSSK